MAELLHYAPHEGYGAGWVAVTDGASETGGKGVVFLGSPCGVRLGDRFIFGAPQHVDGHMRRTSHQLEDVAPEIAAAYMKQLHLGNIR